MRCASMMLLMGLTWGTASAGEGVRYVAVAFHDVVDDPAQLDGDAVTSGNLIQFFEWLKANDWKAITLDDVARAKRGEKPLPERAILLTFDDGYQSLYTRVFPLFRAYGMPVVSALVTSWLEVGAGGRVEYGARGAPRERFLQWEQAREMQRSGLVEFGLHSHDLHRAVLANPWGNEWPAAAARKFAHGIGYETESDYRERVRADLERGMGIMQRELGKQPRALIWPYGRYTGEANKVGLAAGFAFVLTLDPIPSRPEDLPLIHRLLPVQNPGIGAMVDDILFRTAPVAAGRIVRIAPEDIGAGNAARFEEGLGEAIERVRKLGATTVVVDACEVTAEGAVNKCWFPTRRMKMDADVLSRIVWQMRTRAGVSVWVRLPPGALARSVGSAAEAERAYEELGYAAMADGVLMEEAEELAAVAAGKGEPGWHARWSRIAMKTGQDSLAMRCFLAFERVRPGAGLALVTREIRQSPSALAEWTLIGTGSTEREFKQAVGRLSASGWLGEERRYRSGIWLESAQPPREGPLMEMMRKFQRRGGVHIGWSRDLPLANRPDAGVVAEAVSANSVVNRDGRP